MRIFTLALVLTLVTGPVLTGCVSRALVPVPQPGAPVRDDIAGVVLVSGEEIDLEEREYGLREAELVIQRWGSSRSEVRRIPGARFRSLSWKSLPTQDA